MKTVYSVVLFTNPAWGLRSERNRLEFESLEMFTSRKDLHDYLEANGFKRLAKDQSLSASAVEIKKVVVE